MENNSHELKTDVAKLGEIIQEEMDARGWDRDELAVRMHTKAIQHSMVELDFIFALDDEPNVIINDKTAEQLGDAFKVDPQFFLNINQRQREVLKRLRNGVQEGT